MIAGAVLVASVAVFGSLVVAGASLAGSLVAGLDCASTDWDLARDMTKDPAVDTLSEAYPEGPSPREGCDEDDRTVSADAEYRTGLPRAEALSVGVVALERNGWRDRGTCFTKRIGERRVWADVSYNDDDRSDPDSDLLVSMVNVRSAYC